MSQLIRRVAKKGFTLIELMIVVAIIGILAAIAIPKFADLITKSKESAAKGSLGSIRGAVTIYYSDTEGLWPVSIASLSLASKYLDSIPNTTIPRIGAFLGHSGSGVDETGAADEATAAAGNVWYYNAAGNLGQVAVNCTHNDTKSSIWSSW